MSSPVDRGLWLSAARLLLRSFRKIPAADGVLLHDNFQAIFRSLVIEWLVSGGTAKQLLDLVSHIYGTGPSCGRQHIASVGSIDSGARRLNVLFVTGQFPSVIHGGGLRIIDLASELAARGHGVGLFSVSNPHVSDSKVSDCLASCKLVSREQFTPSTFREWLARQPVRYDVIHYVWPHCASLVEAGRAWTRKTVFELIECCTRRSVIDMRLLLERGELKTCGPRMIDLLENWSMELRASRASDEIVALTASDAAFAQQIFSVPAPVIIPTCVSRTAIAVPADTTPDAGAIWGERSAVFIGNFDHYPNRDGVAWYLANVHELIVRRLPGYSLTIVGAGNAKNLKPLLRGCRSVRYVGPVEDLLGALRAARVCLSPLISGAGIRGKLLQYAYVGRPAVTTTLGASGTPFEHGTSIMIGDDPESFAEHVVRLLSDGQLYEAVRHQARLITEKYFSWAPHIDFLERVYMRGDPPTSGSEVCALGQLVKMD